MKYKVETKKMCELCTIKTGTSVARAKQAAEEEEGVEVRVLLPKAMSNGQVSVEKLATENVGRISDDFYTHEGDVIVKLSTPYDAAYIGSSETGILITSFGIVLRKESDAIDMRYLAMFLNSAITSKVLAAKGSGPSTVKLLRKTDIADLDVPLPPLDQQVLLAELFQGICERKKQYEQLIALDNELIESQLMEAIWGE